jgi:hypothetical protein
MLWSGPLLHSRLFCLLRCNSFLELAKFECCPFLAFPLHTLFFFSTLPSTFGGFLFRKLALLFKEVQFSRDFLQIDLHLFFGQTRLNIWTPCTHCDRLRLLLLVLLLVLVRLNGRSTLTSVRVLHIRCCCCSRRNLRCNVIFRCLIVVRWHRLSFVIVRISPVESTDRTC